MGLGDEIMALGRAEREYETHGRPVAITSLIGCKRDQLIWHGNPAWNPGSGKKIIDYNGYRPYIDHWHRRDAIYNLDHRPRAGFIHFEDRYHLTCKLETPYAIIEPGIKRAASPNKNYGRERWAEVIKDFPIPVYQLIQDQREKVVQGAIRHVTGDQIGRASCRERV